jgi:hypothetical protein
VPPTVFGAVAAMISGHCRAAAGGYTRLMIEKPFGRDSETFDELNKLTAAHFKENQLFRLDHYLGKEVILNIATLRWANQFFEPTWNSRCTSSRVPRLYLLTYCYCTCYAYHTYHAYHTYPDTMPCQGRSSRCNSSLWKISAPEVVGMLWPASNTVDQIVGAVCQKATRAHLVRQLKCPVGVIM